MQKQTSGSRGHWCQTRGRATGSVYEQGQTRQKQVQQSHLWMTFFSCMNASAARTSKQIWMTSNSRIRLQNHKVTCQTRSHTQEQTAL